MTEAVPEQGRSAWEKARVAHPELAALFDLHGKILAAQHAVREALPPLDSIGDLGRLAAGKPALTFDDLAVEGGLLARLWNQLDESLRQHDDDWPRVPMPVPPPEALRHWFEGVPLADEHLESLAAAALAPFLWRAAAAILPLVDQEAWRRGHCPACSGKPDFAFLDNKTGARHLVCTRCDGTWLYLRIGCPFCGNDDAEQLAYYPSEDQIYRLYVCEKCRRYLKAIDLRQTQRPVVWAVERITTAALDIAAIQAGCGE